MASSSHGGGQLDATTDRDVVYCHACSHEWYRDEHGLTCPECESDITEIVDPESDPREHDQLSLAPSSSGVGASRYEDDSDPEEADIEEHVGPHGFVHRRSVRDGAGQPHDPGVEPVLNRFYEMLERFGQPPPTANGGQPTDRDGNSPPHWPHVHRTTFTSGTFGGGTASVTIFSGPAPSRQQMGHGHPRDGAAADPFQAIFTGVLRDIGPPQGDHQPLGPSPNFARGLQEILSLFSPANAVAGDAVYSQEALDRIITQLMEANPQSNAAPPASEAALQTLDRKVVDEKMLHGESKTECTICLDEMKIGDQAVFLPCKHWFHEDCVILWLKEHNTCPICRTPIEKRGGNESSNGEAGGDGISDSAGPRPGPSSRDPSASDRSNDVPGSTRVFSRSFSRTFGGNPGRNADAATDASSRSATRTNPSSRASLNDALRTISTIQSERNSQRGRRTPPQHRYDTSQLQRRSSNSPTSPRETASEEYGARMRQRSPSESSRRGQVEGGTGRSAAQGPLGWLRDRFSGNGGSNQGPSRDEQRR